MEEWIAMATITSNDPNKLITEHLTALREFAMRAVVEGQELSEEERANKEDRFRQYAALGDSFRLTEREMVCLIFKGMFANGLRCLCPDCRHKFDDR